MYHGAGEFDEGIRASANIDDQHPEVPSPCLAGGSVHERGQVQLWQSVAKRFVCIVEHLPVLLEFKKGEYDRAAGLNDSLCFQ